LKEVHFQRVSKGCKTFYFGKQVENSGFEKRVQKVSNPYVYRKQVGKSFVL
jgi:hypothetical protein